MTCSSLTTCSECASSYVLNDNDTCELVAQFSWWMAVGPMLVVLVIGVIIFVIWNNMHKKAENEQEKEREREKNSETGKENIASSLGNDFI